MSKTILITNDDGINANGIIRLAEAAKELGEVWVIAPDSQRSAMSHSVTLRTPIEAWEVDFPVEGVKAYACTGTPVDCVRIGIRSIIPGKVDHVFSGINYGFNTATDLQYSATVGAAFEGAFQKVHSTAFSEDCVDVHEVADHYLKEIMAEVIEKPLDYGQIWNVNFPGCSLLECKGVLRDRTVSKHDFYDDSYETNALPNGHTSYLVHGTRVYESEAGSDLRAVFENYVSVGKATNIG